MHTVSRVKAFQEVFPLAAKMRSCCSRLRHLLVGDVEQTAVLQLSVDGGKIDPVYTRQLRDWADRIGPACCNEIRFLTDPANDSVILFAFGHDAAAMTEHLLNRITEHPDLRVSEATIYGD